MSLSEYIKNGFLILKFDEQAPQDILAGDYFKNGLIIITIIAALVGLLFALAGSLFGAVLGAASPEISAVGSSLGVVFGIIMFVGVFFMMLISYGLVHLSARILGGTANIKEYFGVGVATALPLGIASMILSLIPYIGALLSPLLNIYSFVIGAFVVKSVYGFTWGRAIGAVLLPLLLIVIIIFVIGMFAFTGAVGPSTF